MERRPMDPNIKRLLGLREFPQISDERKRELLGSEERFRALQSIDTTTNPRRKREIKKGIVLDILERNLIEGDVLKTKLVAYIGSGTDVEYPLALGARRIVLVDPIFQDHRAIDEVMRRIESIVRTTPKINSQTLTFPFDYGEGAESVTVTLVAQEYHHDSREGDYIISEGMGGIILFASQGPEYAVQLETNVERKLDKSGFIIADHTLIVRDSGEKTNSMDLGS